MARIISPKNNLFGSRGIRKPNRFFLDQSHPLNKGLLTYWPFGDTNSSTSGGAAPLHGGLQDVGQLQNFASVGGTAFTSAPSHHGGLAAGLNGSSSYAQPPFSAAYSSITAGTWCIWIKTSTLNGGWPMIMEQWDTGPAKNGVGLFISNSNSEAFCQVKKSDGTQAANLNAGPVLTDGKWHFLCVTFQPNGSLCSLYVDGLSVASANASAAWAFSGSATPQIGRSGDSFFTFFNGSVSDARIYNRVLSPTEVAQLYAEPYAGIYEFPIFLGSGAAHAVITGTGVMGFSGISFAGVGSRKETGTANLAFRGVSFSAAGSRIHVKGTANLAFGGITISASGFDPGAPGQGLRQFWTC